MKRTVIGNMFAVTLPTVLAVGIAPTVQAAENGCSNAPLSSLARGRNFSR